MKFNVCSGVTKWTEPQYRWFGIHYRVLESTFLAPVLLALVDFEDLATTFGAEADFLGLTLRFAEPVVVDFFATARMVLPARVFEVEDLTVCVLALFVLLLVVVVALAWTGLVVVLRVSALLPDVLVFLEVVAAERVLVDWLRLLLLRLVEAEALLLLPPFLEAA